MPLRDATGLVYRAFCRLKVHVVMSDTNGVLNGLNTCYIILFVVSQLSDPSDLPKNAFSIFLLLVEHLCVEHIDYALEIGLSGIFNSAH